MKSLRRETLLLLVFLVLVYALLVVRPALAIMAESVRPDGEGGWARYLSLIDWSNASRAEAFGNSLLVSCLSVIFSGLVGILLAVSLNIPGVPMARFLRSLAVIPIALPPLVGVIAFLLVFGESGILPRSLAELLGARQSVGALDGITAIIAVHVYSFNVYFYLFCSSALRQIDTSLLEAAAGMGSGSLRTFVRVVLPELRPAIAGASLLTFMASMASFSAPLIFAGEKRFITLEIFSSKLNGDLSAAAAQSVGLVVICIAVFVALRFSFEQERRRAVKGTTRSGVFVPGVQWRKILILCAVIVLVLEMLPLATIVLVSFVREGSWTYQLLPTEYTLENFRRLVADPSSLVPVRNSVMMSLLSAAASVLLGGVAGYVVVLGLPRRSSAIVDSFLTAPYAIPGTVLAIALILAFSAPDGTGGVFGLVGTFWILPLAYVIRLYPLAVRSTVSSLQRVDPAMLEAAESLGAGPWRRIATIVLPAALPGVVSGAVLVVIACLGEFVSSVLLYTYSSRPISVEIFTQLRAFNVGSAAAYSVVLLGLILGVTKLADSVLARRGDSMEW